MTENICESGSCGSLGSLRPLHPYSGDIDPLDADHSAPTSILGERYSLSGVPFGATPHFPLSAWPY